MGSVCCRAGLRVRRTDEMDRRDLRFHPSAPGARSDRARAPGRNRAEVSNARTHCPTNRRAVRPRPFERTPDRSGEPYLLGYVAVDGFSESRLLLVGRYGGDHLRSASAHLWESVLRTEGVYDQRRLTQSVRSSSGGPCGGETGHPRPPKRRAGPKIFVSLQVPLWDSDGADVRQQQGDSAEK